MENISLYRKWRSQTFSDIVSQGHITKTLTNVIKNPKLLAHAYLFSGPRGTGKTSMARIFAKSLNCLSESEDKPCNKCSCCINITKGSSMDVTEIDAASHTSVEMVREYIINKVNFAPSEGKYKIYIIDEVHKLSNSSFNALLKTLEEPPSHVVFILATTNAEDIPPTIISRCQRFDFHRITHSEIVNRLRYICDKENFAVSDSALSIIASVSSGALRDALVLLEQAISFSDGKITASNISDLLGISDSEMLFSISELAKNGKVQELMKLIDKLISEGKDILRLSKDLTEHYRKILLTKVIKDANSVLDLPDDIFEQYQKIAEHYSEEKIIRTIKIISNLIIDIKDNPCRRALFEIAIIKIASNIETDSLESLASRVKALEIALSSNRSLPSSNIYSVENRKVDVPFENQVKSEETKRESITTQTQDEVLNLSPCGENVDLKQEWKKIMVAIRAEKIPLHAILADTNVKPIFVNSDEIKFVLKNGYEFHKTQIEKNIQFIKDIIKKITNIDTKITVGFNVQDVKEVKDIKSEKKEVKQEENKPKEDMFIVEHREIVKKALEIFNGRVI